MNRFAPPTPKDIDIRAMVAVLRRQRRTLVLSAAIVFGAAGLFLGLATPKYTASALVLVDPDGKGILENPRQFPGSPGRDNARVDSEVEILRSDAIALAVIEKQGLGIDPEFGAYRGFGERLAQAIGAANAAPPDPERSLARTLARFKTARTVRRKGLTYLISVAASSRSPAKAAQLANSLAQVYIDRQVAAKVEASLSARDVLRGQIDAARQALAGYEAEFDAFIEQNLGYLTPENALGDIARLQAEIRRAEAERLEIETARAKSAQQFQGEDMPATLAGTLAASAAAGPGEPELRDPDILRLDDDMASLRRELRQAVLSGELPPQMLAGLYALQQNASIARAQYQSLLTRLRELETQAQIQVADSQVVSPAIAPVKPTFPNRNLVLLAALAVSLGAGIGLAFLKEYHIGGVTSANQLGELAQRDTAAVIPFGHEQNAGCLSLADRVVDAPLSSYAESIRKLRAATDQSLRASAPALQEAGPQKGRVVLFTSALPDEGKTTTALALARTYALSGRKTLLIDADLRKPSVHRHLGHEPQTGFIDFLLEKADAETAGSFYARDPASPLAVIMGSARSTFPTDQLLASERFQLLLEQAREVFDMVIVDSPPVLPVVDTHYIAPRVDAVVFVVKWAATGQRDIRAALAPLCEAMAPEAALLPVLVQVPEDSGKPRYGGYSGYSAAT